MATDESSFDAATVLHMAIDFLKLSSLSILCGFFFGFPCALILKYVDMRGSAVREFTILMMFAYGSYISAEALTLSGIISMFSCGLVMAHYCFWNMSR